MNGATSTLLKEATASTLPPALPKYAPAEFSHAWVAVLMVSDVLMFFCSAALASAIVFRRWDAVADKPHLAVSSAIFIILWLLLFHRVGLYKRSFALSGRDEFYYTVAALCLGIAPQFLLFTIVPPISTSRAVLGLALVISIALVGGMRAILYLPRRAQFRRRPRRVMIAGEAQRIETAAASLDLAQGSIVVREPLDDIDATVADCVMLSDRPATWPAWLTRAVNSECDTLILTEVISPRIVPAVLETAARHHMTVAFAPPRLLAHSYSFTLRTDGHQVLIVPRQLRACTPVARLVKRVFDILVALSVTLVTLPVMLLAACALYLESRGPVVFRQRRVGKDGREFDIYKFRSMRVDAERLTGPVLATLGDARVTTVGRFLRRLSIDELPQLFNVLLGDMSIVGPRPERPEFVETLRTLIPRYDERHLVRPGITGWSQIQMKRVMLISEASEKISYDLFYVENWGIFMDVSIILKTALEFLFHRAA